jgi:hypothetical protein
VINIKTLEIDVKSMFEDEAKKVFKKNPTEILGMDLEYWLEAGDGIFTIEFDIDTSTPMEELTFTEFPEPTSALVNNQEWWKTELNYSIDGKEIKITNIPTGQTTVILDFNIPNQIPLPLFEMTPDKKAGVLEEVAFDGTNSYDPDGEITTWIWDFGDGSKDSGETVKYQYLEPGKYTVRLTVRDDSEPYAEAWVEKNLTVEYGAADDFDKDGLRDYWEWENFNNFDQGLEDDYDNDGYDNGLEFQANTDPKDETDFNEDSDGDKLRDTWEWKYFKDIIGTGPNDDPDEDEATNIEEFKKNTDPTDRNSKPKKAASKEEGDNNFMIIMIIIIIIIIVVIGVVASQRKKGKKPEPEVESTPTPERVPVGIPETPETLPPQPPQVTSPPMHPIQPTTPTEPQTPPQAPPQQQIQQPNEQPVQPTTPIMEQPITPEPELTPQSEQVQPEQHIEPLGMAAAVLAAGAAGDPVMESQPTTEVPREPSRDEIINHYITTFNIDAVQAGSIYDAGYIKPEYLKMASVEELAAIQGLTPEVAQKIKDLVGSNTPSESDVPVDDISLEEPIPGEELLDQDP